VNKANRAEWDVHSDNVRAILERDFSYSLMNNTRWMEVFDLLHDLRVRTRIKRIFDIEPGPWTWPSGGTNSWLPAPYVDESHPFRVVEIEWLEIEPFARIETEGAKMPVDHTQALAERLQACHVPFTWHDGVIRIVGHQRRS
jgi:hypothetical protein